MTKDHSKLVAQNLVAWGEAAPIHARHNQARLLKAFADPGFSVLDEVEIERLTALGVAGKDVVHVCCNNGQELISIKRMGAARCLGIDGVEAFLDQGREIAAAAGVAVEFAQSDAMALDPKRHGVFDILVITIGVFSWMPDLERFVSGLASLLRPGGVAFIHEHHPILEMFEPGPPEGEVIWELSYFREEPYIDPSGLDYYGGETYDATPNASFGHKMSDIIMAAINAGLAVERFEELPDHISKCWYNVEHAGIGLPMSYVLELRKG